ncbi:YncE family protein [Halomarina ordinaria]|uniref:YncE family protein n=1 Tax=Halomarina ordinaria TaxID=3033939 RepID=A0ABD5UH07_9EURY|nr:twin-arginine translocation signal domain-containing protein [Halomarina sp. PSRA2]
MTSPDADPLYPNADAPDRPAGDVSRRRLLQGSAVAGAAATAGCLRDAGDSDGGDDPSRRPTVFVFNTGDGTVSLIDPERDERVGTRAVELSSSFPSNQYTPTLTDDREDSLWLNVGRGVRALAVGSLSETASMETGSGANWLERTPDGAHVVVSAREPTHVQFRLDADPDSETFGEVTAEDGLGRRPLTNEIGPDSETGYVFTPGSDDVTVVDLEDRTVAERLDLGGSAFVGTWDPSRTKLYVPVQTTDEVAVVDHERREVVERIPVGPSPYGATASSVRPREDATAAVSVAMARLGLLSETTETTYCIGNCACGHRL